MDADSLIPALSRSPAVDIHKVNALTAPFGLALTPADIKELEEVRQDALRSTGRIEFSGGVLRELVRVFRASPFVYEQNWAETLCELTEEFYNLKSLEEDMPDDELIERMAELFNGRAQGDVTYLDDLWGRRDG